MNRQVFITVYAENEPDLVGLSNAMAATGEPVDSPRPVHGAPPLNFTLLEAAKLTWEVIQVVSAVGGAVTFVDWLIKQAPVSNSRTGEGHVIGGNAEQRPSPKIVEIDGTAYAVRTIADAENVAQILRAYFPEDGNTITGIDPN